MAGAVGRDRLELLSKDETPRQMCKGKNDARDGRYKCKEHSIPLEPLWGYFSIFGL